MRRVLLIAAVLALPVVACFVSFSPAGQPCAPDGGCLATYVCKDKVCELGVTSSSSGSTGRATGSSGSSSGATASSGSGSSSSGSVGCSPACPSSEVCLAESRTCVARTCANVICPFLDACSETDGGASCIPRPDAGPNVVRCSSDGQCPLGLEGYFCLHALHSLTDAGDGLCTKVCTTSANCASPDVCDTNLAGGRGTAPGLCLSGALPTECSDDLPCRNYGLACTYFDDPGQSTLPVSFCDSSDAGPAGSPCTQSWECQSGICAVANDAGFCHLPCASTSECGDGGSCTYVTPLGASGNGQACVASKATRCLPCGVGCGADAPVCNVATNTCDLACNAVEDSPCGTGTSCDLEGQVAFDAGLCH